MFFQVESVYVFFLSIYSFIHSVVIITSKKSSTCSDSWVLYIIIVVSFVSVCMNNTDKKNATIHVLRIESMENKTRRWTIPPDGKEEIVLYDSE